MTESGSRRALTVEIFHAPDVESPCNDYAEWQLYSFSNRHASYRDPGEFHTDGELSSDLKGKLDAGLAWILSYFEHGLCQWMLYDDPRGALAGDWHWDGVDIAGILVWENPVEDLGPTTKEARRASAAAFVETYTQWCNGETYGYEITDSDGNEVASCSGFIGTDNLISDVLYNLNDGDEIVEVNDRLALLTVDDFQKKGRT